MEYNLIFYIWYIYIYWLIAGNDHEDVAWVAYNESDNSKHTLKDTVLDDTSEPIRL